MRTTTPNTPPMVRENVVAAASTSNDGVVRNHVLHDNDQYLHDQVYAESGDEHEDWSKRPGCCDCIFCPLTSNYLSQTERKTGFEPVFPSSLESFVGCVVTVGPGKPTLAVTRSRRLRAATRTVV